MHHHRLELQKIWHLWPIYQLNRLLSPYQGDCFELKKILNTIRNTRNPYCWWVCLTTFIAKVKLLAAENAHTKKFRGKDSNTPEMLPSAGKRTEVGGSPFVAWNKHHWSAQLIAFSFAMQIKNHLLNWILIYYGIKDTKCGIYSPSYQGYSWMLELRT